MKLLLMSSGLENRSLAQAMQELVGKLPSETRIGFVPTAANVEEGNKDWVVGQFIKLWRYGYSNIDIIDPSADGVDWQSRLDQVDVIYVSGGNTFHLLEQTRKTGFDKWLEANKDQKVYVGGSASSILMTPNIGIAGVEPGDPNLNSLTDLTGLGWVDFEISPHVPSMVKLEDSRAYAQTIPRKLYAIDDATGIKVVDGEVDVISEGQWQTFN